jgi:hypothetical protein
MNSKTTKTKTKTTTDKPKENAGNEKADDFVATATSWCAEHNVPTRVMPEHAIRLIDSAVLLDHAIEAAGGPDKVPKAVVLYLGMLNEVALATAMHGIKRAVLGLYRGAGR